MFAQTWCLKPFICDMLNIKIYSFIYSRSDESHRKKSAVTNQSWLGLIFSTGVLLELTPKIRQKVKIPSKRRNAKSAQRVLTRSRRGETYSIDSACDWAISRGDWSIYGNCRLDDWIKLLCSHFVDHWSRAVETIE